MRDVEADALHAFEHRAGGARGDHRTAPRAASRFFFAPGALISVVVTIGAPHMCVTLCSGSRRRSRALDLAQADIGAGAARAIVHGKHQPLQWNIGSVHR
jgi:hypothetical protein